VFGATGQNNEIRFSAATVTLAEALAKAGGLQDLRSDPAGVFLFRYEAPAVIDALGRKPSEVATDGRVPVVYRLDLSDAKAYFAAERFPVADKDILYVANADLTELEKFLGLITPTGIDRVELAYARHLIGGDRAYCFAAITATGAIGALPQADAALFVAGLEAIWRDGATLRQAREVRVLARHLHRASLFGGASALRTRLGNAGARPVYLLVSHHHLDRPRGITRLKQTTGARFACLVHDLIPLEFPQFTRPEQTVRHRRRIDTVAALVDAVIVNSAATAGSLLRHLGDSGRPIPIAIAPLGLDSHPADPEPEAAEEPYFVSIGTIEARKNHALLLAVWRRLTIELGERAPRLVLVGRRGWDADRLPALPPNVTERADLPDRAMTKLLRGARALLLPSFAEGYGLPVIEALAAGVPVLCSDLPALRESGAGAPDPLDPSDPSAWLSAVVEYLTESPRRREQLARLARWQAPSWNAHFVIVSELLADL
jgi:glycosyltransferase involved in cell wall biosynthesis